MDIDPVGILLVKSDSKGDRLLFRYPYPSSIELERQQKQERKNPYGLLMKEDLLYSLPIINTTQDQSIGFPDEVLSTLFAVKQDLAGHKFEVKANNIRFVGYPIIIKLRQTDDESKQTASPSTVLLNMVFALKANADYSIVKCYFDLSKRIGIAIRHEEKRCGYFFNEMKLMMAVHDMVSDRDDNAFIEETECPFDIILKQCSLAVNIKQMHEELCSHGAVQLSINNWVQVSFCVPQKVHSTLHKSCFITPEDVERCLLNIKPFHSLLLLVEIVSLLNSLPLDTSPSLIRFLQMYSPVKNLQMISADSDLTLAQVYNLTGHLLYWGKAMVIFPLSESNIYVIAPSARTNINNSPLFKQFVDQFPSHNLLEIMSDFSLPTTMLHKMNPLTHPEEQTELIQIVAWMLRHRLITQLHTYIFFMPTKKGLTQQAEEHVGSVKHHIGHSRVDSMHSTSDGDTYSIKAAASDSDISSTMGEDIAKLPMTTLQTGTSSWMDLSSIDENDRMESFIIDEDFITTFNHEERNALLTTPASSNPEDFHLLVRLLKQGYLQGSHHIEEIMYLENLRRHQLIQLLEKFSDILITCESEDPAISIFYPRS